MTQLLLFLEGISAALRNIGISDALQLISDYFEQTIDSADGTQPIFGPWDQTDTDFAAATLRFGASWAQERIKLENAYKTYNLNDSAYYVRLPGHIADLTPRRLSSIATGTSLSSERTIPTVCSRTGTRWRPRA